MSNSADFIIEIWKGTKLRVLTQYVGPGGDVVVPENVDVIHRGAFGDGETITSLSLPDHGITVHPLFKGRNETLKAVSFYPCPDSETSLDTVTIYSGAFGYCNALETVEFPSTKLVLDQYAFAWCGGLRKITVHGPMENIDSGAFYGCENITVMLPPEMAEGSQALPGGLCKFQISTTDKGYACLTLFQKGTGWNNWRSRRTPENPGVEFEHMMRLLEQMQPMDYKTGKIVADYLGKHYKGISPQHIERVMALYPAKKSKDMDALTEIRGLMSHLGRALPDQDPGEAAAEAFVQQTKPHPDADAAIKKGIHWTGSKNLCSRDVLVALISCYAHEWDRCAETVQGEMTTMIMLKDGLKVAIQPEADSIAQLLDAGELSALLTKLAKGAKYRPFLLSWARFATEADIAEQTGKFKKLQRGTAKDKYLADNLQQALLLSNTREAMLFYDQIEELDRYARMRGITAMELRDTAMMPDFGFGPDGVKRYDIGGNTIEVRVNSDFSCTLTDSKKNKEIRSIPKKSDDPAKAEAAAKDFAEFKKAIKQFVKLRSEQICRMHMTGEPVTPELWKKIYLEHPVIRHLAELVVWMDETNTTFTVVKGSLVTADQTAYAPQGAVRVAHVLSMDPEDVTRWQHTLTQMGKRQLFEQVWEPVVSYDPHSISARYDGIVISSAERNALKANLKRRGVNVHSGEMAREFNARAWGYEFYGSNTMYLGKSLEVEYMPNDDGSITLAKAKPGAKTNPREINAVLLELDKAAILARIAGDQAEFLTQSVLSQFSAAQISAFVTASTAAGAVNCTAVLLNHKNEHYPEYDGIDAFVLEW